MSKRVCILQVYGEYGIEKYVYHLASELRRIVKDLIIVSNGAIAESERKKLRTITENVYERSDEGFDCGAFKDVLESYLTWGRIEAYEELILVNDSCYGPIYPLEEMFEKMDRNRKDLDFWAVTKQEAFRRSPYWEDEIPYHIQPYFTVIRERLLHSLDFKAFWSSMIIPKGYFEAVDNFELRFASYFCGKGYSCGAYIDNSEFCQTREERMAYIFFNTYKLVSKYRCPLIKRKAFRNSQNAVLMSNAGEIARKTLDHINKNTDYDADLIIEDMIHHMEPKEMQMALHLNYISSVVEHREIKKKVGMIVYLQDKDYAEKCIEYVSMLPAYVGLCIITKRKDILCLLERNGLKKYVVTVDHKNKSLKNTIAQFNYCCILLDRMNSLKFNYYSVKQSFLDLIWENLICDERHIEYIINLFENEHRLGLLAPPEPYFSTFFTMSEVLEKKNENLFTTHSAFWVRNEAAGEFWENSLDEKTDEYGEWRTEIPLGKTLAQTVKRNGCYCGVIMTEEYASLYTANHQFLLNGLIYKTIGEAEWIAEYTEVCFADPKVHRFCCRFRKIYIFGAGEYGHHCLYYIRQNGIDFLGFVVSDGRKYENNVNEKVYELSEISLQDDEGIVVAVGRDFEEIECAIKRKGIKNVIRFVE